MGCMCDMLESLTWFEVLSLPIEALVDLHQILEIICSVQCWHYQIFFHLVDLSRKILFSS